MNALKIALMWLALAPAHAAETTQETPDTAQPAMALIDNSATRLHVALDLTGMLGVGNGLVVNLIIANDEQARVDTTIEALNARLPEGLLIRAVRKGLAAAVQEHGLDLRQALLVPEPRAELLAKVKNSAEIDRALLLRFGTNIQSGNSYPIAITPDFRQLRISLNVELLERRNRAFRRISKQTVSVLSAPASVHLGAHAQDAWAANDGALMAQTIEAAVRRACALALAPPPVTESEIAADEYVDVITALGGERYRGRVVDRHGHELLIARQGGDLLVVPALRVLPKLADAAAAD